MGQQRGDATLFCFFLLAQIYGRLFKFGFSTFKFGEILTLVGYGITTVLVLLIVYYAWDVSKFRVKKIYDLFLLLSLVSFLFSYIDSFSQEVFPKIPAEYGGGAPVKVQFHWKDEKKTNGIAASFQKGCGLKQEPVDFDQILATDTDHVIISPCPKEYPRTFEISNDLIEWVEIKYAQKGDVKL